MESDGYEETLNVAEKIVSLIKSNKFDISAFILKLSHENDIKNKIFEFIDKWKEKN